MSPNFISRSYNTMNIWQGMMLVVIGLLMIIDITLKKMDALVLLLQYDIPWIFPRLLPLWVLDDMDHYYCDMYDSSNMLDDN
jgi:hypothetical protein